MRFARLHLAFSALAMCPFGACAPIAGTVTSSEARNSQPAGPASSVIGSQDQAPVAEATHLLTLQNKCSGPLWAFDGNQTVSLAPLETRKSTLPRGFAGRVWARRDCAQNSAEAGPCKTKLPVTLAEFKLDGWMGLDFYDVSLVDAFNLPLEIAPQGGHGDCQILTCSVNLLTTCPSELQKKGDDGATSACLSGCLRYGTDAACCQNANGTAETCPAPPTAAFFKAACPNAYSFAFDDATSVHACMAPQGYWVTFCP